MIRFVVLEGKPAAAAPAADGYQYESGVLLPSHPPASYSCGFLEGGLLPNPGADCLARTESGQVCTQQIQHVCAVILPPSSAPPGTCASSKLHAIEQEIHTVCQKDAKDRTGDIDLASSCYDKFSNFCHGMIARCSFLLDVTAEQRSRVLTLMNVGCVCLSRGRFACART